MRCTPIPSLGSSEEEQPSFVLHAVSLQLKARSGVKLCTICKSTKELSEFNKHSKKPDGLQTVCRDCNRKRSRAYYQRNLEKHRATTAARSRKQAALLRAYVLEQKQRPCMDCGNTFIPFAMDFDHVRGRKVSNISMMVRSGGSLEKLKAEIAKCDLVCAVCHRVRTWTRLDDKALLD